MNPYKSLKINKRLWSFYLLLFYISVLNAQHGGLLPSHLYTHQAISSGNWSDSTIWNNGIPNQDAIVHIPHGMHVNYDVNNEAQLFAINNHGTLSFTATDESQLKLIVDTWFNSPSSTILMNASSSDYATIDIVFKAFDIEEKKANNNSGAIWSAEIANHFSDGHEVLNYIGIPIQDGPGVLGRYEWDPGQLSLGLISMGKVNIEGFDKTEFIQLDQEVPKHVFDIETPGVPSDWKVGDYFFITKPDHAWSPNEHRIISAIDSTTISFESRLAMNHLSIEDFDFYPHVVNLSRNIKFRSYNEGYELTDITQRAHTMFMHQTDIIIKNAEFFELGRTDKERPLDDFQYTFENFGTDQNTFVMPLHPDGSFNYIRAEPHHIENQRGRYPLHFHRTFTFGSDAVLAKGNSVWGSPGWGMVHHDSNADFIENVLYMMRGGMISESGSEIGTWQDNFVMVGWNYNDRNAGDRWTGGEQGFWRREELDDDFPSGIGYGMQGRGINMIGNIAANCAVAFEYQGSGTELGNPVVDEILAENYNDFFGIDMFPVKERIVRTEAPIPVFRDNIAYMVSDGFKTQIRNERANLMAFSVLDNFLVLNCIRFGFYSTSSPLYHIRNSNFHHHPFLGPDAQGLLLLQSVDNIVLSNVNFYGFNVSIKHGKDFPGSGNHIPAAEWVFNNVKWQVSPANDTIMPTDPYAIFGTSGLNNLLTNAPEQIFSFSESGSHLDKSIDVANGDLKVTIAGELTDGAGTRLYGNWNTSSYETSAVFRDFDFITDDALVSYLQKTATDDDPHNNPVIDSNGNGHGYIIDYMTNRISGLHHPYYFRFDISGTSYRKALINHIAIGKPTTQSATTLSGDSGRAVDGNADGNYASNSTTATADENSWWRVDLEQMHDISDITIHNRTDCCGSRLNGAVLYIGNINSINPDDYTEIGVMTSDDITAFPNLNLVGRYVMITKTGILSLAEVEVHGSVIDCENLNMEDFDNDGVCDAFDLCPNNDDNLIGQSCDDNNDCTINDVFDNNCNCTGQLIEHLVEDMSEEENISRVATISIESNNTIPTGENIDYRAGESVTLANGFEVLSPSNFHAYIQECSESMLPPEIVHIYENQVDSSISDEFDDESLNTDKWAYRTRNNPTIWGTQNYVRMIDQEEAKFVSIRGRWSERKGSGIAQKEPSHYGFHVIRWRTVGISPNKRTPWQPSIWTSTENFSSGDDFRSIDTNGKFTEIDFVEYWYNPVWHSQTITWENGSKTRTQIMRPNADDFPNGNWQVHGLEYHPDYFQLWEETENGWEKSGAKIPITNDPNSSANVNRDFAKAGFWILSNKYHWEEIQNAYDGNPPLETFRFSDSWLHVDYFRYYPLDTDTN